MRELGSGASGSTNTMIDVGPDHSSPTAWRASARPLARGGHDDDSFGRGPPSRSTLAIPRSRDVPSRRGPAPRGTCPPPPRPPDRPSARSPPMPPAHRRPRRFLKGPTPRGQPIRIAQFEGPDLVEKARTSATPSRRPPTSVKPTRSRRPSRTGSSRSPAAVKHGRRPDYEEFGVDPLERPDHRRLVHASTPGRPADDVGRGHMRSSNTSS